MGTQIGWKPRHASLRSAGTRIRCRNIVEELRTRNYSVECFRQRRCSRYDVIVFSKIYDDSSYNEAVDARQRGAKIVFDLYDNHFYNPKGSPDLQAARGQQLRMIELADLVVTSTVTLAEVVREESKLAKPITVIGDAVEEGVNLLHQSALSRWWVTRKADDLIKRIRNRKRSGRTALLWFGIHGGPHAEHGMGDLERVRPVLERLDQEYPLSLTVISNSWAKYRRLISPWRIPTDYLEWEPSTFEQVAREHSIAVVPVTINPFTACKSANRLTQALALGLAVVADEIPSYQEFRDVVCLDQWEDGLRRYLSDPATRARDVAAGQQLIRERWTIAHIATQWESALTKLGVVK